MATKSILLENPDKEEGHELVTFGRWLGLQLARRRLRNKDLLNNLEAHGFHCNGNNISNWLTDLSPPGLERLPVICDALGMDEDERQRWVLEWLRAYLPSTIHPYLRDPLREKTDVLKALMKSGRPTTKGRGRPVSIRNGVVRRPHRYARGPHKGSYIVSKTKFAGDYEAVSDESELWGYIDGGYSVRFSAPNEPPSLISPKSITEE